MLLLLIGKQYFSSGTSLEMWIEDISVGDV